MQNRGPHHRGDAFDRALREAFGEATTLAQIEDARRLYARYRTDDLLRALKRQAPGQDGHDNL